MLPERKAIYLSIVDAAVQVNIRFELLFVKIFKVLFVNQLFPYFI